MKTPEPKNSDSLDAKIPRVLVGDTEIGSGSSAALTDKHAGPVSSPSAARLPTLDELLDKTAENNVHGEVDFGPATGREVW